MNAYTPVARRTEVYTQSRIGEYTSTLCIRVYIYIYIDVHKCLYIDTKIISYIIFVELETRATLNFVNIRTR